MLAQPGYTLSGIAAIQKYALPQSPQKLYRCLHIYQLTSNPFWNSGNFRKSKLVLMLSFTTTKQTYGVTYISPHRLYYVNTKWQSPGKKMLLSMPLSPSFNSRKYSTTTNFPLHTISITNMSVLCRCPPNIRT